MCIGLCGHTSLLGRAKDLKDFVKVGKAKQGFVEITLHNDNGNHVTLKRQLYKDTNSTKWYVNGREEREHKVKEVINNFNVQLDNKCQFLPQDKVVEFAKLDCYQLLEETEKAVRINHMMIM
jgi:chromosome segregation ATPase